MNSAVGSKTHIFSAIVTFLPIQVIHGRSFWYRALESAYTSSYDLSVIEKLVLYCVIFQKRRLFLAVLRLNSLCPQWTFVTTLTAKKNWSHGCVQASGKTA